MTLTRALAAFALGVAASAASAADVSVHYLRQAIELPPVLSNLDTVPEDLGIAGAQLALEDNRTTGRFLGHTYTLTITEVPVGGDMAAAAAQIPEGLILLDAPAGPALVAADTATESLLFNVSDQSPDLRDTECRANLLHTAPSLAMRSDALMQFALRRNWKKLAMIEGTHADDTAFAHSLDRSARKFGLKIAKRKTWAFDADMRRMASAEVPLFTQDLGKHDLLLIADEIHDFGRYIAYNTWLPRPVAGSEGLTATAWSPVVEQWGAAQLQSRFRELAGRPMRAEDYAAWAALRAIGEAVTRTGAADAATLRAYLLSDSFELAGFKGRPLSFRSWNGQLRQTIPLTHPRALVASAPLEGFLHPRTELDTLGLDAPESRCTAFSP